MRIITVATHKGGVGKTTIAAHLAFALAESGKETLFIDLDPQGHGTLYLGIDAAPNAQCVGDALLKGQHDRFEQTIVRNVRKHLSVAPSIPRMAMIEDQLVGWSMKYRSVTRALETLYPLPEVVIIDTAPTMRGAFIEAALHCADLVVVPAPARAGTLQGFGDLKATWSEMQDGRGGQIAIALNMWDGRTRATNEAFLEVVNGLDTPTFKTVIPQCEPINQAMLGNGLLFESMPKARACKAFYELADEVWLKACATSASTAQERKVAV